MEFFRHCPQCGRKFHITFVGKKLEHVDKETVQTPPRILQLGLVLEESVPVTIDIEGFQYWYKCKHCGHEWYEKHTEKHLEKPEESRQ